MPTTRLTTTKINALRARVKPYDTRDADVSGLVVRTHPTGRKVFNYRYRRLWDRAQRTVQIGLVQIGLAQARRIALTMAGEVATGGDPAAERREARAAAQNVEQEAVAERDLAASRRFGAYLTGSYAMHAQAEQKRGAETVARIKAVFAGFLSLDLSEITLERVLDWRAERQRHAIAPTTIDREVGMLSTMLTHAVRVTKLLQENPLREIRPLTTSAATTNKLRYLFDEEEVRLRDALVQRDRRMREERGRMNGWLAARGRPARADHPEHFSDHLEPFVLILLNTGLRFGELAQLRWAAVDFRTKLITVDGDTAKNGRTRHVPMPQEVVSILARWRVRGRANPEDLVFPGGRGRPLVDIKTAFAPVLRRAGIERFRIHDLRHTYASKLVQRGVDLYRVQRLLGHASPAMTQRYAHLAPDHLADAVAVLDQPLPQSSTCVGTG